MELTDVLINSLVALISGGGCSTISWFFARRKYNSEVDQNLIENMEKSLDFYKNLSDDNRNRLEIITESNQNLEKEVHELRRQVLNLTMNICMDLTCANRVREYQNKLVNGKNKDRFSQSPNSDKG